MREFVLVNVHNAFICYFQEYYLVYQYIYGMFFLEFIMLNQKHGVEIRLKPTIQYKNWIDSKRKNNATNNAITTTKTPSKARKADYKNKAESEFERIPIEVDVEEKFTHREKAQVTKKEEIMLL